jgi:hypothetical protein
MSPSDSALVGMIERVYAAALDPARWRDFTNSVGEHFRDGSTMLWHANQIAASHRYEAKVLRALEDRYAAINPWMPKKMLMSSGTLHRTEELYPEDELVKTEFYTDLMAPNDLFKGFGITLFNDRRFSFLSIIRSKKVGAPIAAELHLLAQLTPHLQRALQVRERLELSSPLGAPALAALDELKRGVVFVGPNRLMIYANQAAERILACRDGLFLDGKGVCRASRAAEQAFSTAPLEDAGVAKAARLRAAG